jgi:hypothetical protein
LNAAGGGGEESGEHFDGGGLACSVRAEEAEELAGRDGEIDVLNGREVAETAGEVGGGDGGNHLGERISYVVALEGKGRRVGEFRREIV